MNIEIYKGYFPVKFINCLHDKIGISLLGNVKPFFQNVLSSVEF